MQRMPPALSLALANAGRSMPARIAMIAITTSNSIRVKPARLRSNSQRNFFLLGGHTSLAKCLDYFRFFKFIAFKIVCSDSARCSCIAALRAR